MSNLRKISNEVIKYVVDRKRRNPDLSCRKLSEDASQRFSYKISKSSINKIILDKKLSSPVGRKTSPVYTPSLEASGCGYAFLLGANYQLGLSKIVANSLRLAHPIVNLSKDSIDTLTLAWIMSRAFYNVALDRIADYSKNDIWPLIGRKADKGALKRYLEMFKIMQTVNNNIVRELQHVIEDVLCLKLTLDDNTIFYLDGQGESVWPSRSIPINFSTTLYNSNSYINDVFFGSSPLLLFSTRPEGALEDIVTDFIFSFDGSFPEKRINKIELMNAKGIVIKEVTNIMPMRRRFIVGVWPWQHKSINEAASKRNQGIFISEHLGLKYPYWESSIRFTQHINNKEVMLRAVTITAPEGGTPRIALFTNIDADEMKAADIVGAYTRRHPFFEDGHKFLLNGIKKPVYADDYLSGEKIMAKAKTILECRNPDEIFAILVEILNNFSKRSYFPPGCSSWSLLKMREIFYKRPGLIRRDISGDILFNIFDSNKLQERDKWEYAAFRFNDANITEPSGKRFWLTLS